LGSVSLLRFRAQMRCRLRPAAPATHAPPLAARLVRMRRRVARRGCHDGGRSCRGL